MKHVPPHLLFIKFQHVNMPNRWKAKAEASQKVLYVSKD